MGIGYGVNPQWINLSKTNSLNGLITQNLLYAFDAARPLSYNGSGTTVNDLSGSTVVGTLTNGPIFDSTNLGSIQFDGSDDYIALQNGTNTYNPIGLPQSCTIYTWIKINAQKNYNGIFSHYSGGPVNLGFYVNGSSKLVCAQYDGQWNYYTSTGSSVPTNGWTHLAFTRANSSLGPLKMYINGVLDHTVTVVSPRSLTGGNMGSIGTMWWSDSRFNGNIAMLLVYSSEHTQSQVQQQFSVHKKRFGL